MRQVLLSMQRAIARHRALVAVTLLAAALAALPALNPITIGPSDPSAQQQAFRADHSFAEARDVLASHRELIELGERLLAESGLDPALERMQERLHRETAILTRIVGASDASAYWGAYAELHEVYAEGNDSMRTYWDARAIFERALSELASPTVYHLPQTMPALVYLTSDLFVLAPLILSPWGAWLLPHDAPGYDGSLDFAVWMVPLAAGVLAGVESMAPLRGGNRREAPLRGARTSGDAWARDLGRAWMRATVWGAGAALAVTLPGAVAAALHNGIGDPSYPIVFLTRGNTIASTTVGAVLMERGALVLGIAALASAVALALHALTHSRIPSAAVFASSIALAGQSWYFAPLSPLRGAAPLLPTSYLDPSRATGAAQAGVTALPAVGFGGVNAHTGIAIAAGCTALLLFCTLTSGLLARPAARWFSLHGRSGWAMRLPPTFQRVLYRIGEAPRARTSRAPGDPPAHGPPALAPHSSIHPRASHGVDSSPSRTHVSLPLSRRKSGHESEREMIHMTNVHGAHRRQNMRTGSGALRLTARYARELARATVKNRLLWALIAVEALLVCLALAMPPGQWVPTPFNRADALAGASLAIEGAQSTEARLSRLSEEGRPLSAANRDALEDARTSSALAEDLLAAESDRAFYTALARQLRWFEQQTRAGELIGGNAGNYALEASFLERLITLDDPRVFEQTADMPLLILLTVHWQRLGRIPLISSLADALTLANRATDPLASYPSIGYAAHLLFAAPLVAVALVATRWQTHRYLAAQAPVPRAGALAATLVVSTALAVVLGILAAFPLMPQYFDHLGPLADVVPWLPSTYLCIPETVGAGESIPTLESAIMSLSGVTPERGRAVLGATVLTALALSAGTELYRWGASGLRHDASPTDDAGPSGGAKPADDAGQASGAKPIDRRSAAPGGALASVVIRAPAIAIASAALIIVAATPAVLPLRTGLDPFTQEHYRELIRQHRQTQDPQAATFDAALAAEERRLVHHAAYANGNRAFAEAAASYETWRCERFASGELVPSNPGAPADAERRAAFYTALASLPDPHVITLSSELPAMEYLAYLARIAPAPLWGAPALAAAAATAARVRNGFLRQMPLPACVRYAAVCLVVLLTGIVSCTVALAGAAALACARSGWGDLHAPSLVSAVSFAPAGEGIVRHALAISLTVLGIALVAGAVAIALTRDTRRALHGAPAPRQQNGSAAALR